LIRRCREPLCVLCFDFHPDWDILPPRLHCGSWVTQTLRNNNVVKFVLLGVGSSDISTGHILSANLGALKNDRLEIYPFAHAPTKAFFRTVPSNVSVRTQRGRWFDTIHWSNLEEKDLGAFLEELLKRLPTKNVYISIDKDCLTGAFARTNWEPGRLSLDQLSLALRLIRRHANIVGVDITGDYSPITVQGRFKQLLSYVDHPKSSTPIDSYAAIQALNEKTNLALYHELRGRFT